MGIFFSRLRNLRTRKIAEIDAFAVRFAIDRRDNRDFLFSTAMPRTEPARWFSLRLRIGCLTLVATLVFLVIAWIKFGRESDPPDVATIDYSRRPDSWEPEPPPYDPSIKQGPDVPVIEPPPPSDDPAVVASRAELAAKEGRWALPKNDNVAEHLARLAVLQPNHEAITRLRKQAAEVLLVRGRKQLDERPPAEAAATYRELLEVWPENKSAISPYTEALTIEGRLLRHLKAWEELLPLAEEVVNVSPKNYVGHLMRGQALAGLGRYSDAVAALKTATELNPKDESAKEALAAAKKSQLQKEEGFRVRIGPSKEARDFVKNHDDRNTDSDG